MDYRPQARTDGLNSELVDAELIIYDQTTCMAHCLSADAASVWHLCDGRLSSDEIAQKLGIEPSTAARAVDELSESGLLAESLAAGPHYSRRDAAKRFAQAGGAALLAPLIYSAAIGPATAAASVTPTTTCFANNPGGVPSGSQAANGTTGYSTSPLCGGGTSNQYNKTCYVASGILPGVIVCGSSSCNVYNQGCSGFNLPGTCCAGICFDPPPFTTPLCNA